MIRPVTSSDAESICKIYNYYVLYSHYNFEEEAVTVADMQNRIATNTKKFPWLVYESQGEIVGYAYASEWKSRCSYRYSAETSVYMQYGQEGKGIGSVLYRALLEELSKLEVHAVIGGIAQPNESSIALHEKLGFEKIAHFKEVGYKLNRWIDVGYWEKIMDWDINRS
jgi:L-amino acid N-acyltransferase YncA